MPKKELKEKEEKKEETKTLVVKQLPKQEVKSFEGDDGNMYDLMTTDEAIQEILEKVREIHKAI